jgi:hypothetical protein
MSFKVVVSIRVVLKFKLKFELGTLSLGNAFPEPQLKREDDPMKTDKGSVN